MKLKWILIAFLLLSLPVTAAISAEKPYRADSINDPLRRDVMQLLENIERTRMLLGVTMWNVHELRNCALYEKGRPGDDSQPEYLADLEKLDRRNLDLYETIRPIDYAASSLLAALDLGDDRTARSDLELLRNELPEIADAVLDTYREVDDMLEDAREDAREEAAEAGLQIKMIEGKPWDDPIREQQRQEGLQIGWRTNIEPPANFREQYWNRLQKLDIRYQLKKGQMLGVTSLTFKDPVLRWDWVETNKNRYDFSAFDRMMNLARKYGYKVKLVLPLMGGGVPEWLVKERPQSVIPTEKGEMVTHPHGGVYSHDFMGPVKSPSPWYEISSVNLADDTTRELYAKYIQALADHCRKAGYTDSILAMNIDLFFGHRLWRIPQGQDRRTFILNYYQHAAEIVRQAFGPDLILTTEVTDGEAHSIDHDFSAHEWQSFGLTDTLGMPTVDSETPFFEDLMRAASLRTAQQRTGEDVAAGPFFFQNCEYGFGTMVSINYFTSLLRDGLWSEGWFGPEGVLRWGYFPQIFTYNDRQLQWSGITNRYLGNRQAHLLSTTLANTRVAPADVLMLLPSTSLDNKDFRTHRELIGWGWALTALKVQYDVISETHLAQGVPQRAKLLILPQAVALNEAQVAAIRAFVQNGGTVIASMVPGTDGSKPSPLADVLGCDVARQNGAALKVTQTGVKGTWLQMTASRGLHSGKYTPVPEPDTGYPREFRNREQMRQPYEALVPADGAAVKYSYGTGQPAIVENTFGKGKALTLGYPYGNELIFADWTSIAFGKIYNGWARDRQMLGMVRWLRDFLADVGYERPLAVPEGWRHRLQGFEAAVSSLAYPKGPEGNRDDWGFVQTYLDPRPEHRIKEDHDIMDYASELTWRDRPGVDTQYLAVGMRESAYSGERACVQFWMMPHMLRIRINDPSIKQVYDVASQMPVTLQRDDSGVSFVTSVPPALGRVFAVSKTDTVEIFQPKEYPGMSFAALENEVEAIADADGDEFDGAMAKNSDDIYRWLQARSGSKLTISYGNADYGKTAEKLAGYLSEEFGIDCEVTQNDGEFSWSRPGENFQLTYKPSEAEILIGNEWSNNSIATLGSTWPYNNRDAKALMGGRLTATLHWPAGKRGIALLTRQRELRKNGKDTLGLSYNNTYDFVPTGVDTAPEKYMRQRLLILASTPAGAERAVEELTDIDIPEYNLQQYVKPRELEPLPEGYASLYRAPWRANLRTVSAYDALQGVGIYYKHIPGDWTHEDNVHVINEMQKAGVSRMRLAPHLAIYISKEWQRPKDHELRVLRNELRACKAAGVRPNVIFVHIPPAGKPGTRELQDWWRQGELLPAGEVGSPEFKAYVDKAYLALTFILDEARSAGFTEPDSFDLELGQGMWWGAPSVPRPWPSTTLEDLKPGGRIYEFEVALIDRLRKEGYTEPKVWWGMTYHYFEHCSPQELPETVAGRAISFYSSWTGKTTEGWLKGDQYGRGGMGPNDTWPVRPPLKFIEGNPPELVLARPEGWMADRTRRDNLLTLASTSTVAITSLGTTPSLIPDVEKSPLDGWQIKQRATGRTMAFWLNQGAQYVLIHSAYEPRGAEMQHCMLTSMDDPMQFTWKDAPPLKALKSFTDALQGAKPLKLLTNLEFQFALEDDPVLIPASDDGGPARASDLVALLPYQINSKRFAVAAYVLSPNVAERMRPVRMILRVNKRITDDGVATVQPARQAPGTAQVLQRGNDSTLLSFDLRDDVTFLTFTIE